MTFEPHAFDRDGISFELRFEREEPYKWRVLIFRQGVDTGSRMSLISGPVDDAGSEMEPDRLKDSLIAVGMLVVDMTPWPNDQVH